MPENYTAFGAEGYIVCAPSEETKMLYKPYVFRKVAGKLADLYEKKNHDYGDSFGEGYKEFGITSAVVRIGDKYRRLKTLAQTDAKVTDESIKDTLKDLACYAIMTIIELDAENAKKGGC